VLEDVEQRLDNLPDVPDLTGGFAADQVRSGAGSLGIQANFPPGAVLQLSEAPMDLPKTDDTLPALASQRFLEQTGSAVGDTVNLTINSLPTAVRLVGAVTYFPTLFDDLNAGYLITNRDGLLLRMNAAGNSAVNANEAILAAADNTPADELGAAAAIGVSGLSQVLEAEAIRLAIKADPMGLGLRSVTLFGYVLTAMLSLVGFATYFYFSARQRESMYGVLRSIGMSPRQLYTSLLLEQVLLIVAGVTIGTLLGLLLNRITLPGLPITFGDRPPTPPFIAQNDWAAVGRIYITLAVAFFLALGAATLLLWRTNLHRALRVGEE
jgi:putative ABC transport system permease protein